MLQKSVELYVRTMGVCDSLYRALPNAKFLLDILRLKIKRTVYKYCTLVAKFVSQRSMCLQL